MIPYFTSKKITDDVYLIYETYSEKMSLTIGLVCGTDKSLVIDSGQGCLPGLNLYVSTLTDKPLECLVCHGHPDHVGGAIQFPKAYMNSKDEELFVWALTKERRIEDLLDQVDETGAQYIKEYCVDCSGFQYTPIKDGDIIDLGGNQIEVIETPGHTKGSVCAIDRRHQIIFASDALLPNIMLTSYDRQDMINCKAALEKLISIISSMPEVKIYGGHMKDEVPVSFAHDLYHCVCDVLDNKTEGDERTHFKFAEMNDPDIILFKHTYGDCSIVYNQAIL